jgi:hypothetical protein
MIWLLTYAICNSTIKHERPRKNYMQVRAETPRERMNDFGSKIYELVGS